MTWDDVFLWTYVLPLGLSLLLLGWKAGCDLADHHPLDGEEFRKCLLAAVLPGVNILFVVVGLALEIGDYLVNAAEKRK